MRVGHVAGHHHHLGNPALLVANHAALRFDVPHLPVLIHHAVFQPLPDAGPHRLLESLFHAVAIFGMNFGEGRSAAQLIRIAQDIAVGGAVVKAVALQIEHRHQVGQVVHDQPELLLALAQCLQRLFLLA